MKNIHSTDRSKRILFIMTVPLAADGMTEMLLINAQIASAFAALTFVLCEPGDKDRELALSEIGRVIRLPSRTHRVAGYLLRLLVLARREQYDIVHIHGNSATMALDLMALAPGHIPMRITHAHNCAHQPQWKQNTLGKLMGALVTEPAACSESSGKQLYDRPFRVLPNCIDAERFSFNMNSRSTLRNRFGLTDRFVIGHIGRFSRQKNHKRLIRIFAVLLEKCPNAHLLLVGDGKLSEPCRRMVAELHIAEHVTFCGNVTDPENYLSAMDVFVLPSLFEGLPLVGLEAQASGLPCVFSDTITREVSILPECRFLSLSEPDEIWSDTIAGIPRPDRDSAARMISAAGFTREQLRAQLIDLYGGTDP